MEISKWVKTAGQYAWNKIYNLTEKKPFVYVKRIFLSPPGKVFTLGTIDNIPLIGPYITHSVDEAEKNKLSKQVVSLESRVLDLEKAKKLDPDSYEVLMAGKRKVEEAELELTKEVEKGRKSDKNLDQKINELQDIVYKIKDYIQKESQKEDYDPKKIDSFIEDKYNKFSKTFEEITESDAGIRRRLESLEDSLKILFNQVTIYEEKASQYEENEQEEKDRSAKFKNKEKIKGTFSEKPKAKKVSKSDSLDDAVTIPYKAPHQYEEDSSDEIIKTRNKPKSGTKLFDDEGKVWLWGCLIPLAAFTVAALAYFIFSGKCSSEKAEKTAIEKTKIEKTIEEDKTIYSNPIKERIYEIEESLTLTSDESENPGKFEIRKYETNRKGTKSPHTVYIKYTNKYGLDRECEIKFGSEFLFDKTNNYLKKFKQKSGANGKKDILSYFYTILNWLDRKDTYDNQIKQDNIPKD